MNDVSNISDKFPEKIDDNYLIYLIKCNIKDGKLIPRGDRVEMTIKEAAQKFAPTSEPRARANVLRARQGNYIGMRTAGRAYRNFFIDNNNQNGDIRWLLSKNPNLESSISEIYLVDEVSIRRAAIDLPSTGGSRNS